jgi:hypothetical protein
MNEVESYGEKNVELLLLGNKADDSSKRVVSFEKAKVYKFEILKILSFLQILFYKMDSFLFFALSRATRTKKPWNFMKPAPKLEKV